MSGSLIVLKIDADNKLYIYKEDEQDNFIVIPQNLIRRIYLRESVRGNGGYCGGPVGKFCEDHEDFGKTVHNDYRWDDFLVLKPITLSGETLKEYFDGCDLVKKQNKYYKEKAFDLVHNINPHNIKKRRRLETNKFWDNI